MQAKKLKPVAKGSSSSSSCKRCIEIIAINFIVVWILATIKTLLMDNYKNITPVALLDSSLSDKNNGRPASTIKTRKEYSSSDSIRTHSKVERKSLKNQMIYIIYNTMQYVIYCRFISYIMDCIILLGLFHPV